MSTLLLAAAVAAPAAAQQGALDPPPGWVKGDTHEHLQLCPRTYSPPPGADNPYFVDRTTADVLATMLEGGVQVANVMIWNNGALDYAQALARYAPLVTGSEDSSTAGDPERFIEVGIESSGFPVAVLGHVSFLNVQDPAFDPELDVPFQLMDWFRQQPDVVVGAPHQMFPAELCAPLTGGQGSGFVNPPGYSFVDASVCDLVTEGMAFPTFTFANLFPVFLPLDVASGRVDYLEAIDLTFDLGPLGFAPSNVWYGLYYKLLSLGYRPSIGGGNDVNCAVTSSELPARTYVWMDDQPLDFDGWIQRLVDGHVSLAMGDEELLLLDVQGRQVGEELLLPAAATLPVQAQLLAPDGYVLDDTIELIVDGEVVDSVRVDQPGGGTFTHTFTVQFQRSCWVAARTSSSSTHTAAIHVTVGAQPRCDLEAASYMLMYTGYLDWNLDVAEAFGVVEDIVGDSLPEVRAYVDDARRAFRSRRDFAAAPPAGVTRYGRGAPAPGEDFMPIVIDSTPVDGGAVTMSLFNAPPGSTATLFVSGGTANGIPFDGARILVDPGQVEVTISTLVDDFGHGELVLPIPPSSGDPKYLQFVVFLPEGETQRLASSDALQVDY